MKILIYMPSRESKDVLLTTGIDYLKRCISPIRASHHFDDKKYSDDFERRKEAEGLAMLKKTTGIFKICLLENGQKFTSTDFANFMATSMQYRSEMAFLIGGAFGLGEDVIRSSQMSISLSDMTLPHRLAFLLLCEQTYRASEILRGSPYHK